MSKRNRYLPFVGVASDTRGRSISSFIRCITVVFGSPARKPKSVAEVRRTRTLYRTTKCEGGSKEEALSACTIARDQSFFFFSFCTVISREIVAGVNNSVDEEQVIRVNDIAGGRSMFKIIHEVLEFRTLFRSEIWSTVD